MSAISDQRVEPQSRRVAIGPQGLEGLLAVPPGARGLVIFAHGSGSSRHSARNIYVAERLHERGLGTLLFDLLTDAEAMDRHNVFDIPLLAERVGEAIEWARSDADTAPLPIGLFGASTGSAAALIAAARSPDAVAAVVSRGGRPDLASSVLSQIQAPTLLIVGGADTVVLRLNREAFDVLTCQKRLEIVPRATHLFEEAGALDHVVEAAGDWFAHYLRAPAP